MIRLALIGAGRWGQNILRTLRQEPHVSIDVSDSAEETVEFVSKAEQGGFDGVIIATPGSTHTAVALPFITLGLPCFIEKPLATTKADGMTLVAAARQSGAPVMVGHIHLFNPAYQAVKTLVPNLGALRHLHFEGMNNGPFRADMSALWDWAPHDVAMALDLLGTAPQSIIAWGISSLRPESPLTDTVLARLDFSPPVGQTMPVPVTIHVSWLMPQKRKKLTIVGEKSSIVFDDTAEQKIIFYENMGPIIDSDDVVWQEPKISYPQYNAASPLTLEMKAFLQLVTSKQTPLTPLAHGQQVVEIIEAIENALTPGNN